MNLLQLRNKIKEIKGVVIVDFYQDDCRFCDMLAPQLQEATDQTGAQIFKINLSQQFEEVRAELIAHFSLMSTPTVVIYKDGSAVDRFSGFLPAGAIQARIESL